SPVGSWPGRRIRASRRSGTRPPPTPSDPGLPPSRPRTPERTPTPMAAVAEHRVVIVGAGFGGLFAAKFLRRAPVDVTVVDRRNYHLFQPLLYQVANDSLSPGEVAAPIRDSVGRQKNTRVWLGDVADIDPVANHVLLADGASLPYDFL